MEAPKQLEKFTFFRSFRETIDDLPPEMQLTFFRAIADFALDGTEPTDLTDMGKVCWHTIRAVLQSGRNKAVAGGIGGENGKGVSRNVGNRHAAKTKAEQKQFNSTPTEGDAPARGARRFTPPTVAEVSAYCDEKGYRVDAERFCDYYESKGWIVGKTPMKNWRAAVRTWAKNIPPTTSATPSAPAHKQLPPED